MDSKTKPDTWVKTQIELNKQIQKQRNPDKKVKIIQRHPAGPDRLVKTEAKTARQVKKETETDRQIKTYIKTG